MTPPSSSVTLGWQASCIARGFSQGMLMNRFAATAFAALLAFALPAAAQESRTLRIGSVLDPNSPVMTGAAAMARAVEQATGGHLKIALFPASQLGQQREMWQNVQAGLLDGIIDASASMVNFVPQFAVLDLPFLVPDRDSAFRLLDGPVVQQELVARAAEKQFRVVRFWEATFRNIYTRRPVNSIADLRGLKIRVIPNPSFIALFRELGAAPTPMAFGEIYTSIQQGVIDGAENDSITYLGSRHIEVARNIALTSHMMLINTFVMSERQWQRLPAEQQAALVSASLIGRQATVDDRDKKEGTILADIAAAGATITRPDLAPFRAAGQRTHAQFEERLGHDLVQRITDAAR